jgi:hypothetical protein
MAFRTRAGQLVAYAAGLTLAAFWITAGAPRNWAVSVPDDVHTYGIRFRRGADLFFRPVVGWFIDHGLWVCLGLACAAVVAEVAGRWRTADTSTESP